MSVNVRPLSGLAVDALAIHNILQTLHVALPIDVYDSYVMHLA